MSLSADELVRRFSASVQEQSAVIFCGAGTSKAAGLPLWDEVVQDAKVELGISDEFSNLPLVAQYYSSHMPGGRERLEAHIKSMIDVGANPTRTHHLISQISVKEIWTTNYDTLIEDAISKVVVATSDDNILDLVPPNHKRVVKMHGDFTTLTSAGKKGLVITREDFERYPRQRPRLWARLQAIFATQTMLFVGFSFSDPNIEVLFKLARLDFNLGRRRHFTILKTPTSVGDRKLHDLQVRELEGVGVNVLEISDFGEIDDILRAILVTSAPPHVFVGGSISNSWDHDVFCNTLGSLLARRDLDLICGASEPALALGYRFASSLLRLGIYRSSRLKTYFQVRNEQIPDVARRLGTVVCSGASREEMRNEMLRQSRVAIFIGGGDGTREEIAIAERLGVPVIPIGASGGASLEAYDRIASDFGSYRLNGRPIERGDFDELLREPASAAVAVERMISMATAL